MWIILLAALAATFPSPAIAQTAHFSAGQSTIPTSALNQPQAVAVDANNNLYVADTQNKRVLKETFANGTYTETTIGTGFNDPVGVAVDAGGNVYIADDLSGSVSKETLSGTTYTQTTVVTGLDPAGVAVDTSGNVYVPDSSGAVYKETLVGGVYLQTTVTSGHYAEGIAVDASGNVYLATSGTNQVLKETLAGGTYTQTVIGSGLYLPQGVAVDSAGNVYINDSGNNRLLKETLIAGTYIQTTIANGFNSNTGLTIDTSGNLYLADTNSSRVLKLQLNAVDFGSGAIASTSAKFTVFFAFDTGGSAQAPAVLTRGVSGLDYTDAGTGTCTTNGPTHTYNAGDLCTVDVTFTPKYPGRRDGAAVLENASGTPIATAYIHGIGTGPQLGFPVTTLTTIAGTGLNGPGGIAVDGAGTVYFADTNNNRIAVEKLSGGSYTQSTIGSGLNTPYSVAVDGSGSIYIADSYNNRILKETPIGGGVFSQSTVVSGLNIPYSVAVDGTGSLYIADTFNNRVLKETLSGTTYIQSTIGTGLNLPFSVALDSSGNVYIGDNNSSDGVLKETLAAGGTYTQTTVLAGPPSYGIVLDASGKLYLTQTGSNKVIKETPGGTGSYTQTNSSPGLNAPRGLALDDAGNLYVGDYGNNRAVKLDQADPPALAFATTDVGMTSTDSPQTVTLHNVGNSPLIFPIPAASGATNPSVPANFTWDSAATCTQTTSTSSVPFTLAAGASCTVGFNFQPSAAGTISGSGILTDNTLNASPATQSIPLSGTGVTPDITATHVTVSANTIAPGGTVNLYATVTDTTNSGNIPTGSVTFYDTYNGTTTAPVGSQTISNGQINLTNYMPSGTGNHLITAAFTPNSTAFAPSADNTGQTVAVTTTVVTKTTLALSASSVSAGSAVTLTASIVTAGGSPYTGPGQVAFCDASAAHCTDIHRVGTAQVKSGLASFTFVPGSGTHSYQAIFLGAGNDLTSTSAAATLTVSGGPTSTSITQSGAPGNYTEFTVVTGAGTSLPTGTVSFLDTSNGNYPLGSGVLSPGSAAVALAAGASSPTGQSPGTPVTADFNGDGVPDVATPNAAANTLTIRLNHLDGSFTSLTQALPATANDPNFLIAGDFNNDGLVDLVLGANGNDTEVSGIPNGITFLKGNGDGTFTAAPLLSLDNSVLSGVAADFDGDGLLDLAVLGVNHVTEDTFVLYGKGDGTFSSSTLSNSFPNSLLSADFNNDGVSDLVLVYANSLTTLLGSGSRSFTAKDTTLAGTPASFAAADFNGDGNTDLALGGTNAIALYKGNGDGTFTAGSPVALSATPQGIAAGDFNGDGVVDLAATFPGTTSNVAVFYGTGNGTFGSSPALTSTLSSAGAFALADVNGDGFPDLAVLNGNNIDLLLTKHTAYASVTASVLTPVGAGTHQVIASYPGDANYAASTSGSSGLTAQRVTSALSLNVSPVSSNLGQPVTLTATLTPTTAQAHTTGGETIVFTTHNGTSTLGTGTLSGGIATLTTTSLLGGVNTLTASYAGDTNFLSSLSPTLSYTVSVATATSLTITANGVPATSAASGTVITLTATIKDGSTPVTPGLVSFCDASAPRCTDAHLLGTAQLTSTGTATLKLTPRIGSHSYKAVFANTSSYSGSASPAVALTVTGVHPSLSTLTSSGTAGNYTLTGTVTGTGAAPTGSISFLDTSNANYLLGTAALVPGTSTLSLTIAQTPATGTYPNAIATGDFNGDGLPDLVVTGSQANTLTILLGTGSGTFTLGTTLTGFNNPSFVAVADFNSDGRADIAVANTGSSQVEILLGHGDGTFAAPIAHDVGSTPYALTVADLNNDGIADLATANTFGNTVTILLGNGDGTFSSASPSLTTGNGPTSIVAADFNNDGHPDLAVTNLNDASVSIFLGAGDGTFPSSSVVTNVGNSYHLIAADLNSDGNQDLAVAGSYNNSVTILLGKGDGSFTVAASPATGSTPNWLTAADINGDGIPDLITSNRISSGSVSILLGNGDGTFQSALSQAVGSLPNGVVAADLNGDGVPDLATANSGDNTASILLTQLKQTASGSLAGISPVGTSTHAVDASFPGTASLAASASAPVALTAQPVLTALTLTATPASSIFGQPVTLTAILSPSTAQSHTINGESVVFSNGSRVLGTGTLSGGVATFTTVSLPAGTNSLTAAYASDTNFTAASSLPLPLIVARAPTSLTLSITPTGSTAVSGTPVTLTATFSAALPSAGQIRFCDASAASCTGLHLLGTAQLTGTGTATLKLIPGIGTHSYKALFGGSASFATSLSAVASLTVIGKYPTSTSLTASGPNTGYTLTASVTGTGGTASPTGAVSFLDSTHATTLGSAPLGSATASLAFNNVATPPTGLTPQAVASADFNADGIPDLAIANAGDNTVSILLGHGDGTFLASSIPGTGTPSAITASDFNADGIPDLAVANATGGTVTILLGTGNGTFTTSSIPGTGTPSAITSADFNGDGIADLALTNTGNNTVTVLLGHGDGTFTLLNTSAPTGNQPQAIASADLNGDGIPDLVTANNADNTLTILLGRGDGTFTPAASPATGILPSSVLIADLNADGIPDLAVANSGGNTLTILLGRGDGTFTPTSSPATGLTPHALTLGDFNHDGIPDLAVANAGNNTVSILLGKGDGTFTPAATPATGSTPQAILAADVNGDGTADLVTVNTAGNNASILLTQILQTASATLPGVTEQGTGTYTAASSYPGDTNFAGSSSNTVSLTTVPFPFAAAPAFTPAPGTYTAAQSVVLTDTTPGAAIFYTTDGSVPTTSSSRYSAPVAIAATGTINALASATGYQTSPVATANYVINIPPAITTQPASQTINAGNTATLSVAATGTAPLTYQWYAGTPPSTASPIPGATGPAYTTTKLTATSSFWVQVNNASKIPANSNPATITVLTPPTITTQPGPQIIIATGKTATLSVTATGSAPLTYQWFAGISPDPSKPVPGATSAVFTTPPLTASANYWVQVNNASNVPANSTTAFITVYSLPACTLSVQPTSSVLAAVATIHCSDPQNQALTETLNWGDGTPIVVAPAATIIHTYKAAGTYTVTLTATDTAGLTTTVQQQISPSQSPVCTLGIVKGQVSATFTQYPVTVTASCTDPQSLALSSITLDWGDGTTVPNLANNATYNHIYISSTTVTYNVVLTAIDTAGISGSSAPQPVQIVPAQPIAPGGSSPVATTIAPPTITPASPVTPPATQVTFICSSVSATLNGQTVNNALPSAYGITCASPTVTLSVAPTPVNVTISTTGTVAALDKGSSPLVLCGLLVPFAGLAFVPRKRRRQIAALSLIFVLSLSLSACGGYFTAPAGTATPSGVYYITLVETVVNPPAPTGFIQTSLIVPLPVTPSAKP